MVVRQDLFPPNIFKSRDFPERVRAAQEYLMNEGMRDELNTTGIRELLLRLPLGAQRHPSMRDVEDYATYLERIDGTDAPNAYGAGIKLGRILEEYNSD